MQSVAVRDSLDAIGEHRDVEVHQKAKRFLHMP
jgi:hypothetical protein